MGEVSGGDMGGSKGMEVINAEEIACKGNGEKGTRCEYDSAWFCENPDCKSPVLTSTLLGGTSKWVP